MKEEGGEIRRHEEDIDTGGGKRKKEEVEGYRHKQRTHVLVYMNQHLHAHYKYTSKLILCSLSFSLQPSLLSSTSLPLISSIHYSHLQRHFTVYIVVYIVYSYLQRQFT